MWRIRRGRYASGAQGVTYSSDPETVQLFYDILSEEALLGSTLLDGQLKAHIAQEIRPDDFYNQRNRRIFEAIERLTRAGFDIDQVSVAYELGDDLESVGSAPYLTLLVNKTPTSFHSASYAHHVRETAAKRRIQNSTVCRIFWQTPHQRPRTS